ncbi:MAG: DUF2029 domain-containing protein [Chloroflexi bacterium]|nr:MAG: DUF2029 domain-containing protein [Chloroflexota bacterium]
MNAIVRSTLVAIAIIGAIVALAAIGWPASDYRNNDFFQFWAGPHALFEGASPYDLGWSTAFHARYGSQALHQPNLPAGFTTAYPLWTFVLLSPLAALPFELAAPLWFVLQAAAIALALTLLARHVLVTERRRDAALLAGLAVSFQPTWLALIGGNITALLFALLTAAATVAWSGRERLTGALLGLLIVKPQAFALVFVAFFIASRDRRRLVQGWLVIVMPLVAISFALRPGWSAEWLAIATSLQSSAVSNATAWTFDRAVATIPPTVLVATATGALLVWWRVRRPDPILLLAATVPVSLFVAQRGWSYDQLHLLLPVAVVLEVIAASRARLPWLGAVAVITTAVPWLLYAFAFQQGGEFWSAITPLLFFCLVVGADAAVRVRDRVMQTSVA